MNPTSEQIQRGIISKNSTSLSHLAMNYSPNFYNVITSISIVVIVFVPVPVTVVVFLVLPVCIVKLERPNMTIHQVRDRIKR